MQKKLFPSGRSQSNLQETVSEKETTYIGSLYEVSQSAGEPVSRLTKHIFAGSNRICSVNTQTGEPANPQTYYYHSDHLGSSSVITDATGAQVQRLEYTPYGSIAQNELANPLTRSPVNHYFTGKELDSTGLYFYGARYYDPEIGRFITADTIVQSPYDPQSLNRYSYCRNNPINYIDPTGHWWFIVTAIIAVLKAVAVAAAAHPFITGAILNVALNTRNINSFGSFAAYAGIGAISGGAAAGAGGAIGGILGKFWGTLAGGFAAGLVAGTGNTAYSGASFGQALAFGFVSGGIAAATAGVFYGAGKVIGAVEKAAATRGKSSGVKTPVGQQGKGSATSALNTNKGESTSGSQALSSRGNEVKSRVKINVEIESVEPTGYRYVGPEEAAKVAETGYVPNVSKSGIQKNVFYTPEEGATSALQAQKVYNLPETPTHRIGLDTTKITNTYGGNVEGGTGIEMSTTDRIPAVNIEKLGE